MSERALPPGFRLIDADPIVVALDESLMPMLGPLRLSERDALEGLFARHPSGGSGRGATALVPLRDGRDRLVVRRLLHGGLLAPLLGDLFVGMGRPFRELTVTSELLRSGAPVPRPAFALGRRAAGPLWRAVVATWQIDGSRDALSFLEARPDAAQRLAAARALGRAVRRFHDAGGRHGDLHVKNLLLRGPAADGGFEAWVIDLDKARVTPGLTPEERMAQLMRLFRSLVKRDLLGAVGSRGCARFLAAYCGDDRALRRALRRRLPHELRRVALHRLGYGPGKGRIAR